MQLIIMRQDAGSHVRGDVIEQRATSTPFAPTALFCMAECPDLLLTDYPQWGSAWWPIPGWEVKSHDDVTDTYRLRLYNQAASSTQGFITADQVQTQIEAWGGTVVGPEAGGMVFDIAIGAALQSQGHFEFDVTGVVFNEQSYDSVSGIHRISADYTALGNNPTYVEQWLLRQGVQIISHANKVVVYEGERSAVRAKFEEQLVEQSQINSQLTGKRRYFVSDAVVSNIEGNGGTLTVTEAQLLSYVQDRADG